MNLYKLTKIVMALFGLAGIIFLAMIIAKGDQVIAAEAIDGDSGIVDPIAYAAYIISILTVALVVYFVIKNLFANTKTIKTTLIGVGAFAAILIVSYVVSSGADAGKYFYDGSPATETEAHLVSAGLIAFYILVVGAGAALLLSGFKKISK